MTPIPNMQVIVVVSPLNALMQDQVEKLMAYMNVCVMKASTELTEIEGSQLKIWNFRH